MRQSIKEAMEQELRPTMREMQLYRSTRKDRTAKKKLRKNKQAGRKR